ncbi:glycosyltransferase [Segetibacter aerophilus]|nr:glycosyltransferase [Segetibacter aerophilus]
MKISKASRDDDRVSVLEIIGNSGMGGMENYIKGFLANLPINQFSVTCICPFESPFTDTLRQLGVEEVYITPIEDDPPWRSIQLAVEVIRLHDIDVLHAHMPKAHALAGLAGSLTNKPTVATIHGMNVTSHELGITRAVGSHVITNCQEAYIQALAMGISADRANLVRNGVDTKVFVPNGGGKAFRNHLGLPKGTPVVGFVSRLEKEKGPDLFLRAAEIIHQKRPDVHFVIVGEGFMHDELEKMVTQMQLDKNVHFAGWWDNTPDIYPAFDVLAHTSRSDGTSLVLLEAMACGCPTVGIGVGGVREIIEIERTGFVSGAGDWQNVGDRILQLLNNPALLKSMKEAARTRVEQHFNVAINTKLTAKVLRQVAERGRDERFSKNTVPSPEMLTSISLTTSKD